MKMLKSPFTFEIMSRKRVSTGLPGVPEAS